MNPSLQLAAHLQYIYFLRRTRNRTSYGQMIESSLDWHRHICMQKVFFWWTQCFLLRRQRRIASQKHNKAVLTKFWNIWVEHRYATNFNRLFIELIVNRWFVSQERQCRRKVE